jgi:hypothetical protein
MAQPKAEVSDDTESQQYCICKGQYDGQEFMIQCNQCNDWFHGRCVGIQEHEAFDIETYHCPACSDKFGPLVLKRRRNFHRHDYSEIDSGSKAIQSGTLAFIYELKKKRILDCEGIVKRLKGEELTVEYLNKHGLVQPIIVEEKDGLGIVVPDDNFTILDVEKHVGSMRDLDVIDVSQQEDFKMKMRHWTEYYESRPRRKVLNVISLEFSDTSLGALVHPPATVAAIDWINLHWPVELHKSGDKKPQVQKYCLMSVENSYTDFHVDFGGTSVWYHVLKGKKVFYLIPPTTENLKIYEQWVSSSSQSEVFFGDLVEHCYEFCVLAGNTFFIPSGWIHAVFTPTDSLVFGGNFLHEFCIKQQLYIYELEVRLKTPEKFRHPKYEKLVWLAAEGLQKEFEKCKTESSVANEFLLPSAKSLYTTLSSWSRDRKHCKEIPESVNEVQLLGILENCVALAQEKYGVDCDPSTSPSQWQRSSFVSGDPLKLKLKRDSSIKPRQAPSTSRSPKQSRKRLKERFVRKTVLLLLYMIDVAC